MAKDRERRLAEELFINSGKTAKEVSEHIGVTEKTIGVWITKYKWKERRTARMSSTTAGLDNINRLIDSYAEKLIEMESDPKADESKKFKLVDAIAKLNKTKDNFEKEHRIPYNVYINVMETIMGAMLEKMNPKNHAAVLEFFEEHTDEVALKYN